MKIWWGIAFGVVIGFLGAGLLLLVSRTPRGEAIYLSPPPTPVPLSVHVTGAVVQPGVYALFPDARIQDAIEAAGGLTPEAQASNLNLAAFIQDGERIWVPYKSGEDLPNAAESEQNQRAQEIPILSPTFSSPSQVNINTATQSELESLPGIGPVLAQEIIAYREQHGFFSKIEDLQEVSGIGPATFEKLRALITVGE